jgi:AcrR family transcriptional regulator
VRSREALGAERPVQPGETFEYRFALPDAGTFWYHPHTNETVQLEKGLYGALVVRGHDEPRLDRERVLVLDDLKLDRKGNIARFGGLRGAARWPFGGHLFARQGFEGTSMQEIGEAAGVARSTPAYFFRSKDALYETVLTRVVARAEKELASTHDAGHGRSPEEAVVAYVHTLIDLLGRDQNLVRLIQRESLREGTRMAEFLGRLTDDAVEMFTPTARQAGVSPQRLRARRLRACLVSVRACAHAPVSIRDEVARASLPR